MSANRPAGITALAVFHFIFGGLGLLCGLCGAGLMVIGEDKIMAELAKDPEMKEAQEFAKKRQDVADKYLDQKAPWHRTWLVAQEVLTIGLSLALLIAGVGLIQMKSWGRWLSILYAVVSIGTTAFTLFFTMTYVVPAQAEAIKQFPAESHEEQQGDEFGQKITPAAPGCFLIYPLIVLAVMLMPGTARAFSDQGRYDDDDYRREDYGTRGRRRDDYDDNGGWAEN